jgi:hypothetical protein
VSGEEVELALAILRGAADVEPVGPGHPAEEGDAVGEETGEELALDGDGATRGDAGEQAAVEQVDAGVHGIRGDLGGIGLLDEAPYRAAIAQLDEAVRGGVGHPGQVNGRRRLPLGVEGEHGAEVRVGEDVAVEDDHEAGHAVHRVPHPARGAERLVFDHVGQAHAPGGAVAHGRADRVHHVGAGQDDVPHAVAREERELIGEERDVQQGDDRLGPIVGEGP